MVAGQKVRERRQGWWQTQRRFRNCKGEEARLGMQPVAAGDVWQSRMGQGAWRTSSHEFGYKAEFRGS